MSESIQPRRCDDRRAHHRHYDFEAERDHFAAGLTIKLTDRRPDRDMMGVIRVKQPGAQAEAGSAAAVRVERLVGLLFSAHIRSAATCKDHLRSRSCWPC